MVGTLDASKLSDTSVLVVGNAWGDFTATEIEAVREHVANGGGLLLLGLGWSWIQSHPTLSLDDYPMIKLAAPFGVRWLSGYIADPTHQLSSSSIFQTFYPNITASFSGIPNLTGQPLAQTVNTGASVTFSVTATGAGPFSYQWQFDGKNLAGATNSSLTQTNLTFGNAGHYRVAIANFYGTATSDGARLRFVGLNLFPVLTIADVVGSAYRIEVTSDLVNTNVWTTLTNFTLPSSPYDFIDKSTPQPLRRFYRAVPVP